MKLALQRKEAAEALGVGVDTFDRHIRPHLRCCYVGDLRLWPVSEIERWLDANATRWEHDATKEKRGRDARTSGPMAQGVAAP